MIKVKNFLDAAEADDGQRIWVEPIGLAHDLREWCKVDHVLSHLGPPRALWEWFEEHPDGYDYFRANYHESLAASVYKPALAQLARTGGTTNLTLLHQGDDPAHNSATALYEFLIELQAWSPREGTT